MRLLIGWWWRLLVLAGVMMSAFPDEGAGGGLAKLYPELASRKGALGRTVVLVDVVLVDDIGGNVEKIKLASSFAMAEHAVSELRRSLAERGVPCDSVVIATIGLGLNPLAPFQSDSIEAHGPDDAAHVIRPPFYVDSLFADPELRHVLREFMGSAYVYQRKKGKPPGYLAEPVKLAGALGADTIGLLQTVSWGIPMTKQFFVNVKSFTRSHFILTDGKSGEVLWKTLGGKEGSASAAIITDFIDYTTKELP